MFTLYSLPHNFLGTKITQSHDYLTARKRLFAADVCVREKTKKLRFRSYFFWWRIAICLIRLICSVGPSRNSNVSFGRKINVCFTSALLLFISRFPSEFRRRIGETAEVSYRKSSTRWWCYNNRRESGRKSIDSRLMIA